jgi:pantetheine-phosphate adenylyltransferase
MLRIAVYPASLDPIHNGHIDVARRAARIFDEVVVAVYDMPKKRLLFSVDERVSMAQEAFKDDTNIRVAPYSGLTVNMRKKWVQWQSSGGCAYFLILS